MNTHKLVEYMTTKKLIILKELGKNACNFGIKAIKIKGSDCLLKTQDFDKFNYFIKSDACSVLQEELN